MELKDEGRYQKLQYTLALALEVCPPDRYQTRQNDLTISIAEFLLEPYYQMKREQVKEKINDLGEK